MPDPERVQKFVDLGYPPAKARFWAAVVEGDADCIDDTIDPEVVLRDVPIDDDPFSPDEP